MEWTALWIAEDDVDDAQLYRQVLAEMSSPYPLRFFENGLAMLESLRAMQPIQRCLLTIDGYMPKLTGIDLIGLLHQENRLCQHDVVMLTDALAGGAQHMVEQYGVPVLQKPGSITELRQIFKLLLQQPSSIFKNPFPLSASEKFSPS